jgi:hypothetical protein
MKLSRGIKANFRTLQNACEAGRLALLDCQDARTGEHVPVVVAINSDGEDYAFVPLAKMFVGNPYDELNPPNAEGAYWVDHA